MAKCKDCLHYEACLTFSKFINAARDVEQGCEHFIDRIKYVEVVRCKDCKYCLLDLRGGANNLCMQNEVGFLVKRKLKDFCSYGEKREV